MLDITYMNVLVPESSRSDLLLYDKWLAILDLTE
jgi:hypothetical protein